ncbi:hypothetical protein X798_06837 [Onchocerca flexuosa]|uniref:Uncharacterized protein n=1 Tax=Onchocerca flexuosa TaxID=387005 RepID=A0A238BLT9_9BILA|nr:hypothetical protein X798_06837 [Onchocerca flexuosa]
MPTIPISFQIAPLNSSLQISFSRYISDERLINNHPRSAVIFPTMYRASVDVIYHEVNHLEYGLRFRSTVRSKMREAKLILAFKENLSIEADVNAEIVPFRENCSVPIIYALHIKEQRNEW